MFKHKAKSVCSLIMIVDESDRIHNVGLAAIIISEGFIRIKSMIKQYADHIDQMTAFNIRYGFTQKQRFKIRNICYETFCNTSAIINISISCLINIYGIETARIQLSL